MDTTTPPDTRGSEIRPVDAMARAADVAHARAYDRRHANRRAVFALRHELTPTSEGHWRLRRLWQGVAGETLAEERVDWHPRRGLIDAEQRSPSLGEMLTARAVAGHGEDAAVFDTVRALDGAAAAQERRLRLPAAGFTLASAPLEIAAAWPALLAGRRVRRQFLVLKVQRHAAVDFSLHAQDDTHVDIALTPVALPLRWLFGRTHYRFRRAELALETIDGLLDPRDRRANGRWIEYLGRVEFEAPVRLAAVAAAAETRP